MVILLLGKVMICVLNKYVLMVFCIDILLVGILIKCRGFLLNLV